MEFNIHQMMAVIATDIEGGGLSDGSGGHINLNVPSVLHRPNVLAVGRLLKHLSEDTKLDAVYDSMLRLGARCSVLSVSFRSLFCEIEGAA